MMDIDIGMNPYDAIVSFLFPCQGPYLACMTAILKQMDDMHYAHYISTFKTRQDIIVSTPTLCCSLGGSV